MTTTLWMPPITEVGDVSKLVTDLRWASNSAIFASNLSALRNLGYGLEYLYGKLPTSYRPLTVSASQPLLDDIKAIFQQYALYRLPVTVATMASETLLAQAGDVLCQGLEPGLPSGIERGPLFPATFVQINPCRDIGVMRHFAYSYAAAQGGIPPDNELDAMIVELACSLFGNRPKTGRNGIFFDYRRGLLAKFAGKQFLLASPLGETAGKLAAGQS